MLPQQLGTVFGAFDPLEATRAVPLAIDNRINLFDVSPYYGLTLAEKRLGQVLPEFDRSSMVVATKVGRLLRPFSFAGKTRRILIESLKAGDFKRIGGDAVKVTRRLARGKPDLHTPMGAPFDQGEAAFTAPAIAVR